MPPIDHTVSGAYDAFLASRWKTVVPKPRKRGAGAVWRAVATALKIDQGKADQVQQLSEAVLRFLDEDYPGILGVYPTEAAPLASVQRALELWHGHPQTDATDKEEMITTIGDLYGHVRLSHASRAACRQPIVVDDVVGPTHAVPAPGPMAAVSVAARGREAEPPTRSSTRKVPSRILREPTIEDVVTGDEEDEVEDRYGTQLTTRGVKKEVASRALQGPKRIYDGLPVVEDPCVLPDSELLRPERWLDYPKERIYRELSKYFLDIAPTNYNRAVIAELRAAMEKDLPIALDDLYKTMRESPAVVFPFFCRSMDKRLSEYLRKKILARYGQAKAAQYVNQCRAIDPDIPMYLKAAHTVLAKDFQAPSQNSATGAQGCSTAQAL